LGSDERARKIPDPSGRMRRDESRFLVMDEREKSGSYTSDRIFDLTIGSRIYFFLAREREKIYRR
jgi:hypothetical protein